MKITHYGQDYAYLTIGKKDHEITIYQAKQIERLLKKHKKLLKENKELKAQLERKERENGNPNKRTNKEDSSDKCQSAI